MWSLWEKLCACSPVCRTHQECSPGSVLLTKWPRQFVRRPIRYNMKNIWQRRNGLQHCTLVTFSKYRNARLAERSLFVNYVKSSENSIQQIPPSLADYLNEKTSKTRKHNWGKHLSTIGDPHFKPMWCSYSFYLWMLPLILLEQWNRK